MKNWKTTLIGAAFAVANLVIAQLQNGIDAKAIALSAFGLFVGLLAKDFNVTGGTVDQDKE